MRNPVLPEYQRIAVILNPLARGGRRYRAWRPRLQTVLRDLQIRAEWFPTQGKGDATRIARSLGDETYDLILVCGGDGTVNEVVNGWIGRRTPLAVLPFGTSNILARVLGVRSGLEQACIQIFYGRPEPFRLARANNRFFLLMTGVGFDAEIVRAVDGRRKHRQGRLAFVHEAVRRGLRPPDTVLSLAVFNRSIIRLRGYQAIVTLVYNYGGFFTVIPRNYFRKAPMWLCCFHRFSPLHLLKYAGGMVFGRHVRYRDVTVHPSHALEVRAESGQASYQVDGEWVGYAPVRITLTEEFVRLVRPVF